MPDYHKAAKISLENYPQITAKLSKLYAKLPKLHAKLPKLAWKWPTLSETPPKLTKTGPNYLKFPELLFQKTSQFTLKSAETNLITCLNYLNCPNLHQK